MSDEANFYTRVGAEFAAHHAVDHTRKEYAYRDYPTGRVVSINVSENFYSILKRGIMGTYHSISEAHLHRYLKEFDFRYNNRSKLGVLDAERAAKACWARKGSASPITSLLSDRGPHKPLWTPLEKTGRPQILGGASDGLPTRRI